MIIYEVNCLVDKNIAGEFAFWLQLHVDAVLQFESFSIKASTTIFTGLG